MTAFAAGPPGSGTLFLRYRLDHEPGGRPERVQLFVAIRPFQVLPPWQALNVQGGVSQIPSCASTGKPCGSTAPVPSCP